MARKTIRRSRRKMRGGAVFKITYKQGGKVVDPPLPPLKAKYGRVISGHLMNNGWRPRSWEGFPVKVVTHDDKEGTPEPVDLGDGVTATFSLEAPVPVAEPAAAYPESRFPDSLPTRPNIPAAWSDASPGSAAAPQGRPRYPDIDNLPTRPNIPAAWSGASRRRSRKTRKTRGRRRA